MNLRNSELSINSLIRCMWRRFVSLNNRNRKPDVNVKDYYVIIRVIVRKRHASIFYVLVCFIDRKENVNIIVSNRFDKIQIERIFDSIMMDYPINSFLFWKVPKEKVVEFKFYEFLRNYHQKDGRHNPKVGTFYW